MTNAIKEFIAHIRANDLRSVTALLEAGIDVHWGDDYVLLLSAQLGALNMVKKLLEYGADHSINNGYVLRYCVASDRLDIVTQLLEFGVNVNAYNDGPPNRAVQYFSALEVGVYVGKLDMVTELLEYNADVHICDDYALQLSIDYCYAEIATVLLENGANVCCDNKRILKDLRKNFNEKIADVVVRNVSISSSKSCS